MGKPSYPSRHSLRLRDYDYSQAGAYFITLCTKDRACLFGHIADGEMHLSPAGEMIREIWEEIPKFYSPVEIDEFVVMPNHVHGIVVLQDPVVMTSSSPSRRRLSVPEVLHRYKSFTTHKYGQGVKEFGWPRYNGRLWQESYHDRIIRNERELNAIREYILQNPLKWELDRENAESEGGLLEKKERELGNPILHGGSSG